MAAPTYELLIAYAAGELSGSQADAVAAYLLHDTDAAGIVNAWKTVRETVRRDDSVAPSAAAVQRARSIFTKHATITSSATLPMQAATWLETAQRFIARLVYDSRVQPAAVRFAGDDDRINLTFETDHGEIDVQAERIRSGDDDDAAASHWRVMGQISEPGSGPCEIALTRRGERIPLTLAGADENGGFAFEAPPGIYDLVVHAGAEATADERVIVLSQLELP